MRCRSRIILRVYSPRSEAHSFSSYLPHLQCSPYNFFFHSSSYFEWIIFILCVNFFVFCYFLIRCFLFTSSQLFLNCLFIYFFHDTHSIIINYLLLLVLSWISSFKQFNFFWEKKENFLIAICKLLRLLDKIEESSSFFSWLFIIL